MNARPVVAEFAGTCLLAFVVVGSGITVEELGADGASSLFFHAVAVGLALAALISVLGSTSGAHFNPAVTLAFWTRRAMTAGTAAQYWIAQILGALAGLAIGLVSFGEPMAMSATDRSGWGPILAEGIATLVLVLLILGLVDQDRSLAVAPVVGAWVAAAVFSTVSTGFLNPALTLARMFTDSFTGIAPSNVPGFVIAQLIGALLAVVLSTHLLLADRQKGT